MADLASLFQHLLDAWRALPIGPFAKGCLKILAVGFCFYLLIYAIERAYKARTRNYGSRMFAHDVAYGFYYYSGLNKFLFTAAVFAALEQPLSFLDLKLLTPLPFVAQVTLYYVVADFVGYWIHRAEHHFRFLWAFHSTHHSQSKLTFATTFRFHPVEHFYQESLRYIPMRILGVEPMAWALVYLLIEFNTATQHTQIPWRLGPFYKVLATPTFHSYHHSIDPAHHNRNYGGLFSFWDYLFGTAVKDDVPKPVEYGLENVRPTSLWSTLVTPFRLLYAYYIVRDHERVLSRR